MVDILLVNPAEPGHFFERMPPLGLAYIGSSLENKGFSVKIIDFEVCDQKLTNFLHEYRPVVVGISGTTHTRFASFELARQVKQYNSDIITVYGGVHATFTAVETLKNIKEIDYVITGEGEIAMTEFFKNLNDTRELDNVAGLVFRSGDRIIANPAQRIDELDSLPMPAYHLLPMDKYAVELPFINKKAISLLTSRGCTARCVFCSASRMFDHRVTRHSSKRVIEEVEILLGQYAFEGIKIFDSTLTIETDHINGICDEIFERKLKFPWECEIRVGTVDRNILAKMKDAGCYYVNFGIESASQRILNRMRKGFKVEQAEELLRTCRSVGLKTKVFFSFGHIGETMEEVDSTFRFIDRNRELINIVASGAGVRIYPGTELEGIARKEGFLPAGFEWSKPFNEPRYENILQSPNNPLLIQPNMGLNELEDIALSIYQQRFSGLSGLKRGLKKITDPGKWRKLFKLAKVKLRKRFSNKEN
ncbi:hypothetical protein A2Y85_00185 [candidate division WOR-3 bacterium RBG_13_43_14]|uniref:Uncharacterized protein n=1 Tax=candidate division WOR-3 bacterium RBG_13_43_14 TaxID=1802590 RepID=A0A1F4UHM2_UNCW3|nr:MAG: hypothetical protein A2Y85_00185 [candidate division WOR-3 bacterium RBG_13_43_14]